LQYKVKLAIKTIFHRIKTRYSAGITLDKLVFDDITLNGHNDSSSS